MARTWERNDTHPMSVGLFAQYKSVGSSLLDEEQKRWQSGVRHANRHATALAWRAERLLPREQELGLKWETMETLHCVSFFVCRKFIFCFFEPPPVSRTLSLSPFPTAVSFIAIIFFFFFSSSHRRLSIALFLLLYVVLLDLSVFWSLTTPDYSTFCQ